MWSHTARLDRNPFNSQPPYNTDIILWKQNNRRTHRQVSITEHWCSLWQVTALPTIYHMVHVLYIHCRAISCLPCIHFRPPVVISGCNTFDPLSIFPFPFSFFFFLLQTEIWRLLVSSGSKFKYWDEDVWNYVYEYHRRGTGTKPQSPLFMHCCFLEIQI